MATVTFLGNPVQIAGHLPAVGSTAPDFQLVDDKLNQLSLANFAGKRKILNIFPSLDTPTCAASVRNFNLQASSLSNTVVLCISADLPFAQGRFYSAEGIKNVTTLSTFRNTAKFANDYGVQITDAPLLGLTARAVIVLDEQNKVLHSELVAEIANEPNYKMAIAAL